MVGRRERADETGESTVERAAAERAVHTCTVVGAAGVGKSRLVQEFAESAGGRATVVTGACAPYGEVATFAPLREVVEQVAAGRPLVEVMRGTEHADMVAQLVAAAVGMGDATGAGDVFWAVGRFLEAGSRARPLVVVLEDVHWASPTMLALVEFLSGWQRPAAVVLVCLARPELLEEHPGWAAAAAVDAHRAVTTGPGRDRHPARAPGGFPAPRDRRAPAARPRGGGQPAVPRAAAGHAHRAPGPRRRRGPPTDDRGPACRPAGPAGPR